MPERKAPAALLAAALALAALASAACKGSGRIRSQPPRNVILIVVDTLRADRLSAFGYARPTSPEPRGLRARARCASTPRGARPRAPFPRSTRSSPRAGRPPSSASRTGRSASRRGSPRSPRSSRRAASTPSPCRRARWCASRPAASIRAAASPAASTSSTRTASGSRRAASTPPRPGSSGSPGRATNPSSSISTTSIRTAPTSRRRPGGAASPPARPRRRRRSGCAKGTPIRSATGSTRGSPTPASRRADLQHLKDLYDEEIGFVDAQLGALLGRLRRTGLLKSSLVILAADHGEEFLEHGDVKHCRNLFDTSLHVPLLVRIPATQPRVVASPVQNLDLVPTVLDYLGIDVPASHSFAGRSLRPEIEGRMAAGDPICAAGEPAQRIGRPLQADRGPRRRHHRPSTISRPIPARRRTSSQPSAAPTRRCATPSRSGSRRMKGRGRRTPPARRRRGCARWGISSKDEP